MDEEKRDPGMADLYLMQLKEIEEPRLSHYERLQYILLPQLRWHDASSAALRSYRTAHYH